MIEEHLKLFITGLIERNDNFRIFIKKIAPEDLEIVGFGIFVETNSLRVRLRYVYKTRAKALAKLDDLLPTNTSIELRAVTRP